MVSTYQLIPNPLSSTGVPRGCQCAWLFMWVPGIKLRSSCLCDKHFIDWLSPPVSSQPVEAHSSVALSTFTVPYNHQQHLVQNFPLGKTTTLEHTNMSKGIPNKNQDAWWPDVCFPLVPLDVHIVSLTHTLHIVYWETWQLWLKCVVNETCLLQLCD